MKVIFEESSIAEVVKQMQAFLSDVQIVDKTNSKFPAIVKPDSLGPLFSTPMVVTPKFDGMSIRAAAARSSWGTPAATKKNRPTRAAMRERYRIILFYLIRNGATDTRKLGAILDDMGLLYGESRGTSTRVSLESKGFIRKIPVDGKANLPRYAITDAGRRWMQTHP